MKNLYVRVVKSDEGDSSLTPTYQRPKKKYSSKSRLKLKNNIYFYF